MTLFIAGLLLYHMEAGAGWYLFAFVLWIFHLFAHK